jgi:beta-phosphoglucomutase
MIKSIIFDFDGVIVDTELDRFNFIKKELFNENIILDDSIFPNFLGRKTSPTLKEIIPNIHEDTLKKLNIKRQRYLKDNITKLKPLPNITVLLNVLKKKYSLGITTGSNSIIVRKFLKYHKLLKYFTVIITGEQFKSSKPDPECYNMALNQLSIKPSEAIIIEDSKAGISAGKKAGCKVFGLKNKHNAEQIKDADKAFNDYKEMSKYFKENI